MAESVMSSPAGSPVHFLWIGRNGADSMFVDEVRRAAAQLTESGRMHFAGEQPITGPWFAAADIFVLPSREEPMGMVALEAATAGCAVACFADAGGLPTVLGTDGGLVVPFEDSAKLAEAVLSVVVDGALRGSLARAAAQKVIAAYDVGAAAPRILEFVEATAGGAPP
jgi:glycosyltransferase involved in cell wall biosynthesis